MQTILTILTTLVLLASTLACPAPTGHFIVAWDDVAGVPVLPPMENPTNKGVQLRYTNELKQLEGGYVACSAVGKGIKTALVVVNASKETLAWISTNCIQDLRDAKAKSDLLTAASTTDGTNKCVACGKAQTKEKLCLRCATLSFQAMIGSSEVKEAQIDEPREEPVGDVNP